MTYKPHVEYPLIVGGLYYNKFSFVCQQKDLMTICMMNLRLFFFCFFAFDYVALALGVQSLKRKLELNISGFGVKGGLHRNLLTAFSVVTRGNARNIDPLYIRVGR